MFKRLNRVNLGQIDLREQEVLEGRRLRALALGREGDADLGEEALHSCRGCWAAEVLPSHHLEVGELLLVLTFKLHGLTFTECLFNTRNVFRV